MGAIVTSKSTGRQLNLPTSLAEKLVKSGRFINSDAKPEAKRGR